MLSPLTSDSDEVAINDESDKISAEREKSPAPEIVSLKKFNPDSPVRLNP